MASDLVQVGGLWLKTAKDGSKFMSGEAEQDVPEGARLMIFRNTKKTNDRQPDYRLMMAPAEQPAANSPAQRSAALAVEVDDDSIPF